MEEKSAPGFKTYKDCFTLLLGANLTGDCKLKPVLVYHAETPRALKGYEKNSLPVHWYPNSSGWMTGHIFQEYSNTAPRRAEGILPYLSKGLPFKILMVLDNASAHPQMLQGLHSDFQFMFLSPNTTFLLQPMDQGVIHMFKTHFLKKSWCSLSLKCNVSLDELEKTAQPPENPVELQKDAARRHWKSYTICDALWHVRDAVLHPGVMETALSAPRR